MFKGWFINRREQAQLEAREMYVNLPVVPDEGEVAQAEKISHLRTCRNIAGQVCSGLAWGAVAVFWVWLLCFAAILLNEATGGLLTDDVYSFLVFVAIQPVVFMTWAASILLNVIVSYHG